MNRCARLIIAAALVVALGCSGNDNDVGADHNSEDVADVTDKALDLSDLPTGWAEDNSADEGSDDTLECIKPIEADENNPGVAGRAEVSYMEGTGIPNLTQRVAQYDSADNASTVATTVDEILDDCGSFEEETDDGEVFDGQIGKVSFPDVPGVDSQANYQLSGSTSGVNVSAAMLVLQVDDLVTFLFWIDLGSFDADAVLEVATTAVEKLAA